MRPRASRPRRWPTPILPWGNDLAIVPVLNKIDMQASRPEEVKEEIMHTLGIDPDEILAVSAKTGLGVPDVFARSSNGFPIPAATRMRPCGGSFSIPSLTTTRESSPTCGWLTARSGWARRSGSWPAAPTMRSRAWADSDRSRSLATNWVSARSATSSPTSSSSPTSGSAIRSPSCQPPRSRACRAITSPCRWSFAASSRPRITSSRICGRRLQKLALNDSSFSFEPETSDALGFGFRCGFLGMLHMEIVQQRLERESNLALVQTAPTVTYEILNRQGETMHISNPTRIPDAGEIEEFREPIVKVNFILPSDCIGAIMQLCEDRRGVYIKTEYLSPTRAILTYDLPLAEMIYDLYDKLKAPPAVMAPWITP